MMPTLESCRALLACGITSQFETWHEGYSSARTDGRHRECGEARSEGRAGALCPLCAGHDPRTSAAKPARLAISERRLCGRTWQRTGACARTADLAASPGPLSD